VRPSLAPAVLALGLSSATVVEAEAARDAARPRAAVKVGDRLPDFEATSLTAESFSLRTALAQHKAVVVLFLSTVCPFVNRFAPHLRELDGTYGPQGVLFVGVNSNNWEPRDEMAEHARERGFQFIMIKDKDHVIADRLDADRTPEAFLVDSQGTLRYRGWVKSRQESPDLKRAIEAVLRGRPVTRPRTKAFGCAVDRY
jgi:peroxiredoxin